MSKKDVTFQYCDEIIDQFEKVCKHPIVEKSSVYYAGVDLGTACIVVAVLDENRRPVAGRYQYADVVRDGMVVDYFGAVQIIREMKAQLEEELGVEELLYAAAAIPPGTDTLDGGAVKNVIQGAGFEITNLLDESTAANAVLRIKNGAIVDIGGGTTGIAVVKQGKVTYSADEATGGHHISLTLAGNRRISLEEAEQYKRGHGEEIWPAVKPVYEKMADIVARHIEGQGITDLWLAGGSCMQPGVAELFRKQFPALQVHLPQHSLFMTPLAIASSGREKAEGLYAK